MPESAGVVSGVSSEGTKRSLEEETSSSKEGTSSGSGTSNKRVKQDLQGLPTRQYLDQTVVPILLQVCVCDWVYLKWKLSDDILPGPCQFGQRTATGPDWVLGWVLTKVSTLSQSKIKSSIKPWSSLSCHNSKAPFPSGTNESLTRMVSRRGSLVGLVGWQLCLQTFYILIGWHSCMESTNLDGDVCHLWV